MPQHVEPKQIVKSWPAWSDTSESRWVNSEPGVNRTHEATKAAESPPLMAATRSKMSFLVIANKFDDRIRAPSGDIRVCYVQYLS